MELAVAAHLGPDEIAQTVHHVLEHVGGNDAITQ